MECRDAQFYLRLQRHATDELGADVAGALSAHLASCPACAADGRAALAFDRAVASAMRAVPVPPGQRERLVTHAAAKQGAALRGRLYRGATVAAAALVLVALGLGVFSSTRPHVPTHELVQAAEEQWTSPRPYVQKWLAAKGLPDELPWDFQYERLRVNCSDEEVAGRHVPVVALATPEGDFAKVYVFRDGAFKGDPIGPAQDSNFHAMEFHDRARFPGVRYVVVHTGQDLAPFLRPKGGAGPGV